MLLSFVKSAIMSFFYILAAYYVLVVIAIRREPVISSIGLVYAFYEMAKEDKKTEDNFFIWLCKKLYNSIIIIILFIFIIFSFNNPIGIIFSKLSSELSFFKEFVLIAMLSLHYFLITTLFNRD